MRLKKAILVLLVSSYPFLLKAQDKGVEWTNAESWQQVLKKAKAENKYIFVDCYTTWCAPCRAMDKTVYINDTVGNRLNGKFISVKVQMDKTEFDKENVKKWYDDAKDIESQFAVRSYPTFLFFSPMGKPLHKSIGYKGVNDFVKEISNALNPDKQYYAILEKYKPGIFDTSELKGLVKAFRSIDKKLAEKLAIEYISKVPKYKWKEKDNLRLMSWFTESVAIQNIVSRYLSGLKKRDYMQEDNVYLISYFKKSQVVESQVLKYLSAISLSEMKGNLEILVIFKESKKAKVIADKYIMTLDNKDLYTKTSLQFLADFTKTSRDKGFNVFYKDSIKVDKIMEFGGYSKNVISRIVDQEQIAPYFKLVDKDDNVPWQQIRDTIQKKYSKELADEIVLDAKVRLYKYLSEKYNKNWKEYIDYYIEKVERYGTDTSGPQHKFIDAMALNNFVYDVIFYHATDKMQIDTGLKWMEGVIRRNPIDGNNMDTYANLLYKAGRKEEAINWQERALKVATDEKQDWCISSIKSNLAKMKSGQPTWETN